MILLFHLESYDNFRTYVWSNRKANKNKYTDLFRPTSLSNDQIFYLGASQFHIVPLTNYVTKILLSNSMFNPYLINHCSHDARQGVIVYAYILSPNEERYGLSPQYA